jgi:hypothetical protein
MNRIFYAVLVFSILSAAVAAQNAPSAPKEAKPADSNAAPAKSSPFSPLSPRKIDRSAAYYHYTVAHMYEEQVTVYGRSELANKAMDEYRLAIEAPYSKPRTFSSAILTIWKLTSCWGGFICGRLAICRAVATVPITYSSWPSNSTNRL